MYAAPAKTSAPLGHLAGIIFKPKREWATIAPETGGVASLYYGYVMPLAALAALCTSIGIGRFGLMVPFFNFHMSFGITYAVLYGVIEFIKLNLQVFLGAVFLKALANNFHTVQSTYQSTKVAAYSMTPIFLCSVLGLYPPLALVGLIGAAYGVYLMYLGIRYALVTPKAKAIGYLAATIALTIVVTGIAGSILGLALKPFTPPITPDMFPPWMRPPAH